MSKPDFETVVQQEIEYLREVHPTDTDVPSCVNHFDNLLACNALRTQVKWLYRYGHRPDCTFQMDEFKYCLSSKLMHSEERRDAWIRRRAEWWAHRRLGKSSEDVWDMRKPEERLKNWPQSISDYIPPNPGSAASK